MWYYSSIVNRCQYVKNATAMEAHCFCTHGVEGSKASQVKTITFSCSRYVLTLHYKKDSRFPKFCIYEKSTTTHPFMAVLLVALTSIAPSKFVRLPLWHYRL
jgi:hypothetical protein